MLLAEALKNKLYNEQANIVNNNFVHTSIKSNLIYDQDFQTRLYIYKTIVGWNYFNENDVILCFWRFNQLEVQYFVEIFWY